MFVKIEKKKMTEVFTTWRLTSSRILGQKLFKVVCEQTSPPAADPPGLSSASSLKYTTKIAIYCIVNEQSS
jgi:hypothetical protein